MYGCTPNTYDQTRLSGKGLTVKGRDYDRDYSRLEEGSSTYTVDSGYTNKGRFYKRDSKDTDAGKNYKNNNSNFLVTSRPNKTVAAPGTDRDYMPPGEMNKEIPSSKRYVSNDGRPAEETKQNLSAHSWNHYHSYSSHSLQIPIESIDSQPDKPINGFNHQGGEAGNGLLSDEPIGGKIESLQERQDKLDEALRLCQQAQQEWKEGFPDTALESLDCAYDLIIGVDPNGDTGIFQQKEDMRFLISKRIVEIYASRQRVVNGKHNEIPLVVNQHVEREIRSFLGEERDFFIESYKRSGLYRTMILRELHEAGLPESLSWLPLIESGFKTRALSSARALGLWQFIPSTGYKFGLDRTQWVDERMDPLKSTKAAIEYLTELHHIFGDWTTVLAAYNCGEGTVLKVIRDQHINYLDNFWDLYERLPLETARYVPRFLATLCLVEDPEKYGIALQNPYEPMEYELVKINKQIRLTDLAREMGINPDDLIELNPELRQKVLSNKEYVLKVPLNMEKIALASIKNIPVWSPPSPEYLYHRVKRGETLSHIARKYRTTVRKIVMANRIKRANRVRIGQRLKIPVGSNSSYASLGAGGSLGTYTVKKGDCSYQIARKFGMELNDFLSVNNFSKNSIIYPGQRVLVKAR